MAGSASAQALPTPSSCSHGATGTQRGEISLQSQVRVHAISVTFSGLNQQTHAQMLCQSGTPNGNNKAYFGIQIEDVQGSYIFVGIGTRAGDYDCGLTGAGIGHFVFTYSGGNWFGMSNEVYNSTGEDSHGCVNATTITLQIKLSADEQYWELYVCGITCHYMTHVGKLGWPDTSDPNPFHYEIDRMRIIDGVGYGGNSDMYGQNNGSDYLHASGAVVDLWGQGWYPESDDLNGLAGFGDYTTGTYTSRFAEGGISNGMNAYTLNNAS